MAQAGQGGRRRRLAAAIVSYAVMLAGATCAAPASAAPDPAPPAAATPAPAAPGPVFYSEVACEHHSGLGASACRRAFQVAHAVFQSATHSYPNRLSCYRAFGPCMPWPAFAGPATRFRPQFIGVSLVGTAGTTAALPVLAPGHAKLVFAPRLLSAALPETSATPTAAASEGGRSTPATLAMCRRIAAEAAKEHLPPAFLARLLWQESSFRAHVVSSAGALGIAQFMPGTAFDRGLADPLDPEQAIQSSAALLGDLARRFGNLGLAAAAYNGGPARVSGWLQGRRTLAPETEDYVVRITGRTARSWAAGDQAVALDLPPACLDPAASSTARDDRGRYAASIGSPRPTIPLASSASAR